MSPPTTISPLPAPTAPGEMRLASFPIFAALCMLAGSACDSGEGTEGDVQDATGTGPSCADVPSTIATMQEMTPAGFTGQQLLATAVGAHAFTLQTSEETQGLLRYSPASQGVTGLLTIEHLGGQLRHVVSTEVPCTARYCPAIAVICPDRVELDVQVSLFTQDGAFAEAWPAKLVTNDPTDPDSHEWGDTDPTQTALASTMLIAIDEAAIQGSFRIDEVLAPANASDIRRRLWLDAEFRAGSAPIASLATQVSWEVSKSGIAVGNGGAIYTLVGRPTKS